MAADSVDLSRVIAEIHRRTSRITSGATGVGIVRDYGRWQAWSGGRYFACPRRGGSPGAALIGLLKMLRSQP